MLLSLLFSFCFLLSVLFLLFNSILCRPNVEEALGSDFVRNVEIVYEWLTRRGEAIVTEVRRVSIVRVLRKWHNEGDECKKVNGKERQERKVRLRLVTDYGLQRMRGWRRQER